MAKGVTYYFEISSRLSSMGGSLVFAVTSPDDSFGTGPCTAQLTGTITRHVSLTSGTTCLQNAIVAGGIDVQPGAQVLLVNTTVKGSLVATGASALTICNSSITGSLVVRGSTGFVLVGDGGAASATCGGNRIGGSVVIGGPGFFANTSGIDLGGNIITGQVSVTNNKPNPASVLIPQNANIEIAGNHVRGGIGCTANTPAPVNDGLANTMSGRGSGQCASI